MSPKDALFQFPLRSSRAGSAPLCFSRGITGNWKRSYVIFGSLIPISSAAAINSEALADLAALNRCVAQRIVHPDCQGEYAHDDCTGREDFGQ
ncbi:hypothetical protein SAMN04488557_2014 [Hyphomicrobium facile]|uniref:Uncharacterized protein n=1 Tax=Hyphomicrobium facile TaxID=51670 RepID=A0A1I7NFQ6_9HYPH|nr:hypothetical protein SAMN04488557_2014 [Hyphomicrobium facile]